MTYDLFEKLGDAQARSQQLAPGARLLGEFAENQCESLILALEDIFNLAPLRHMTTPGGHTMSVAMSNCGQFGWVSDRQGYRYQATDPETGRPWPDLPDSFIDVAHAAAAAAGFENYTPDACLINCYEPGARLSLHQDKNERDAAAPVVSISLGLPAIFLFGGLQRDERPQRYRLQHGDAVVWGGPARFCYHGIAPLAEGNHSILGRQRISLTFRKAM
jgi:alkylated DNA repair protein (DNA oxidative demethylase)